MIIKTKFLVTTNSLLSRAKGVAIDVKFHTKYHAWDRDLFTLLKEYERKAFVYFLVSHFNDQKYIIYIGRSSDQSNRMTLHRSTFEYDELFLFSVPQNKQKEIERCLIEEFCPLYNIDHNKQLSKEITAIGIGHSEYKSRSVIKEDIKLFLNSCKMDTITYFLPTKYIMALQIEAGNNQCDMNSLLARILKENLSKEIVAKAVQEIEEAIVIESELISAQDYANLHGKSVEQVKVHCRNGRIIGVVKQGRDWCIPRSAPYPEDRRWKNNKM